MKSREKGVALTVASYLDNEAHPPQPSIRLAVQTNLSHMEMMQIINVL